MTDIMVDVPEVCLTSGCTKSFGHDLDPTDEEHGPGMYAGQCVSCIHWKNDIRSLNYYVDLAAIPDEDEENWGVCELITQPDMGAQVTVRAYTKDHEDYASELIVRKNFGCVLHEEVDRDDPGTH